MRLSVWGVASAVELASLDSRRCRGEEGRARGGSGVGASRDPHYQGGERGAGLCSCEGERVQVHALGHVEADSLWELGTNKTQRPVWISFVASPSAARAFTANFRGGARASRINSTRVEDSFEVPKSSGHRWVSQEVAGMTVTTA